MGNIILHMIHMYVKRMINCGIDGMSRGITNEGVMKGVPISRYIPFDKGAAERSQGLLLGLRLGGLKRNLFFTCFIMIFMRKFLLEETLYGLLVRQRRVQHLSNCVGNFTC